MGHRELLDENEEALGCLCVEWSKVDEKGQPKLSGMNEEDLEVVEWFVHESFSGT